MKTMYFLCQTLGEIVYWHNLQSDLDTYNLYDFPR